MREGLTRVGGFPMMKNSEKQIPRGLKSPRNDNLQSVIAGTTEVVP
jgi:hypothetical protein